MSGDQLSTGKVSVVMTVGLNGHVAGAKIVGGSSEELIRVVKTNTLGAVANWIFAPATRPDGKPAAVRMSVEFNFHRSNFRGLNGVPIHN